MNVALVYDRVNKWGGAERVLQILHKLYPNAPLYTAVYNPETAPWAKDFDIRTSFLQNIPIARTHHEWFPWLTPLAFESFSFDEYDLVISVTSADAKGVITKPKTKHICYCLTPTRYLWSHYHEYFTNSFSKYFTKPIINYLRNWDLHACKRPDLYIAISKIVQKRIRTYYKRDSELVYPPLVYIKKTVFINKKRQSFPDQYFLIVSRLVRYKKIDIAIKACNKLNIPLVIIGSGSDYKRLSSHSGPTIQFLHNLTDQELAWYYQHSNALIMPQEEDFGLVALEAQSFGTPVISYRRSGASECIIDKKTGILINSQSTDELATVLESFEPNYYNRDNCINNAARFNTDRFEKEIRSIISKLL